MTVGAATALRTAFERAGYDDERISEALHVAPPAGAGAAAANRRRLADDALGALVRLFLVGECVPAAAAFTDAELAEAVDAGLLGLIGDEVEAPVAVVPWQGALVVHDHERAELRRADHVAGIGPATRTLASLTVRSRVGRALDIGAGSGAQALMLARHAAEVVATDINPRALALASTTLRLNGIDNVELREGSFFEPLAGERFDLIAANPPWVVSPDSEFVFRDAGLERDELSRMFVQTLPRHLTGGGIATPLASWLHGEDEDWSAPVRGWLEGSGCDAVILRYVDDDAISYGTKWTECDADTDRWIDYYRAHGVERDERLALAPHRLEEQLVWTGAGYAVERLVLRLDEGVGVEAPVEPAALQTPFALDGSRPLRGLPGVDEALPTVRRLFELGFAERR